MTIHKTAVIGAGTMGSQIAAQMANGGAEVVLLDIVPEGANDRSKLAKEALEKMKQSGRAFTHPSHAEQITPGNLEDDLERLSDVDWIVEAVVEKLEIKQQLYKKLEEARKKNSIISSNTSSIPLKQLKEELPESLRQSLCITHFFNPPRQMQLVELVSDEANDNEALNDIEAFLTHKMGKTIVKAHDTPGFIANRIGIFWMMWGLEQAIEQKISVELADSLLGKSLGFPKTGIFGLMDMVGLDLMLDITQSLQKNLPEDDPYQQLDKSVSLLQTMVEAERTGNKGKGGFYRNTDDGKQVFGLQHKTYRDVKQPDDKAVELAQEKGLHTTFEMDSKGGNYVWEVLSQVLCYSVSLVPKNAENLYDIDNALKLGFNWKRGPFEMIDAMGNPRISGTVFFAEALRKEGKEVPPLLEEAAKQHGFYKEEGAKHFYLTTKGDYKAIAVPENHWKLADKTRGKEPLLKNDAGQLWDIGDGIACLQFTTKMDIMDHATFDLVEQTIDTVRTDFKGLIIGDDDRHFSAGLDLNQVLAWCEDQNWEAIENILERGQQTWMKVKYAPFPVVGCAYGKALGGACELLLHCDCIQAHIESHIGLVETSIGLVPSWGGCKELLWHHVQNTDDPSAQVQAASEVFTLIADAKTSDSAEDASDMHILRDCCGISMHRDAVLNDAKKLCLKKAKSYTPPSRKSVQIPLGATKLILDKDIKQREHQQKLGHHRKRVLQSLAFVLSGGTGNPELMQQLELKQIEERQDDSDVPTSISESEILTLERRAFMALIKTRKTQERIKEAL